MIEVEFDVIIMTFYGIILKFNLERLEKVYFSFMDDDKSEGIKSILIKDTTR